jgi:hypothetical protein
VGLPPSIRAGPGCGAQDPKHPAIIAARTPSGEGLFVGIRLPLLPRRGAEERGGRAFALLARSLYKRGMDRVLLAIALAVATSAGCGPSFKEKRTPSGDFCSDMPIIPAGQEPDREYHRLQPIQSDPKTRTEAERLESLRKAACAVNADAVIEAVNEEVRGDSAQYTMVSSGTAVLWLRPQGGSEPKQLTILAPRKPTPVGAAADAPPPPPDATAAPAPDTSKSAKPAGLKPPRPGSKLPQKTTPPASPPPSGG